MKIGITRNFLSYSLPLAVQKISQLQEFHDRVIQLVQRDARNPVNERIDVRSVLRFVADIDSILPDGIAKCLFELRCRDHVRFYPGEC